MTTASKKPASEPEVIVTEQMPVVDQYVTTDGFVEVRHKDEPKDGPTWPIPREYFERFKDEKGFVEAK